MTRNSACKRIPSGRVLAGATLALVAASALPQEAAAAAACERTVTANVVALDNPVFFNRLGAQNVNWMMYALRRDVVDVNSGQPEATGGTLSPGRVELRADKRPRPVVLRVSAGECLQVNFENLLAPVANPNNGDGAERNQAGIQFNGPVNNNQVKGRFAGFHVQGLELVGGIDSDASFVGENGNSLVPPGESATYTYRAVEEGGFLVTSYGATFGGEATGGNVGMGLFGMVNVEPVDAEVFRSQVTEEEMRLATERMTDSGHPVVNYDAVYPNVEPWISEGKAGLPVLAMETPAGEIVHSDINAIVAYRDPATGELGSFPAQTYPLESEGLRNPSLPNRLEPFREFASIFHDETAATQAFPGWFNDPVLSHTLASVRDAFMINYGSGGIGSEIIGDRLGVGPMHDCMDCAYEEFFLSSWGVGDPGMNVDIPANFGLEQCDPNLNNCDAVGPKANFALYQADPANVHHSYTGDFVKFRNTHAGPKEQHIFHLHNHQWLFNPNDDNSNYLDAQGIGPGSSYSYEIAFGGGGNRNKTAGDAIYHCHFYPHFAQGMWYLWRIHDVFEPGTELAVSETPSGFHDDPFELFNGTPANNLGIVDAANPATPLTPDYETTTRALPDGEIVVGTPIPAVVPLPGKPMAPMPGEVVVRAKDANGDGVPDSAQAKVNRDDTDPALVDAELNPTGLRNPGYPFWIAGIEHTVGQRATTPPLDMDPEAGGFDGGLPRHTLEGSLGGSVNQQFATRLDFSVEVEKAKPFFFPQEGTDVERAAMAFHQKRCHDTFLADGSAAACDLAQLNDSGKPDDGGFITNGAPPVPGAPFNEPCIDDQGDLLVTGGNGEFFTADGLGTLGPVQFGAEAPREYKAAVIQTDVTFNKVGYHYPQQRIITLWEDVAPTLAKTRPPEPFVLRLNTFDCADYLHANLVPKEYKLDDYQVDTPTDVIGQHIHLPKWDLTAADGAANGWNYEDGTLAPGYTVELIEAINLFNAEHGVTEITDVEGNPVMNSAGEQIGPTLEPLAHPFFGPGPQDSWVGARVTIQRWFSDPVLNAQGDNRGLGVTFTHDHFSPSTHQQVGLYGTMISEPAGSEWRQNETGDLLYDTASRDDGGPTSWQAAILTGDTDGDGSDDSFREFYFEYGDFQHAYEKGTFAGVGPDGLTVVPPTPETFLNSINPSFRQEVQGQPRNDPPFPDVGFHPPFCPGGVPRPCPEAVDADDVGMLVVNYRNEPVGLRVFDPDATGPDGRPGTQAAGDAGDLALALQSRSDRAIPEMGTRLGDTPYPPLNSDLANGDAFTPMIRAQAGDLVRVRTQAGAHEHEHNNAIEGTKWLQGGSGFGSSPNSGWRASQNNGIAEQFTFTAPVVDVVGQPGGSTDRFYSMDMSHDGWWSGIWGLMRTYATARNDLFEMPNGMRGNFNIGNAGEFNGVCPKAAPVRTYDIAAVLANDVLGNALGVTIPANANQDSDGDGIGDNVGGPLDPNGGTLVYNPRSPELVRQDAEAASKFGPLHDPTAIMYVQTADLTEDGRLRAGAPVEPVVLRAAAGECVEVTLRNRLPEVMPDLAGYNTLLQVVNRDRDPNRGLTWFHNNLVRPSSKVGLEPQLLASDVTRSGSLVGRNQAGLPLVDPGEAKTYRFYAGDINFEPERKKNGRAANGRINLVATPVEFGGSNLLPVDKIKHGQKGLSGSLIVEPRGSSWVENDTRRDHQVDDPAARRETRTSATVTTADGGEFRDLVTMFKKGQNHRFADGSAVENIAGEGQGVPEDSHDSGQMSLNYATEPMWFRFGLSPDSPFGNAGQGLGAVPNPELAYSNTLVGEDPVTPVFTAEAGQEVRMRVLMATGSGRGTTFNLHGHVWQRDPYVCPGSADLGLPGKCTQDEVGSRAIGENPIGWYLNGQESVTPAAHFDVVVPAGGRGGVPGDYLFRDHASFGNTSGLWGILRVTE